ncbi:MAG: hypothetical protein H6975_10620 [Gammaproteobacteria bacterium]|nr:hypothetical protein [Gammaproteobacteria bacterium]
MLKLMEHSKVLAADDTLRAENLTDYTVFLRSSIVKELLREIDSGKTSFTPSSNTDDHLAEFQSTVELLRRAHRSGYIKSFTPHEISLADNSYCDQVSVEGLTSQGREYLQGTENQYNRRPG